MLTKATRTSSPRDEKTNAPINIKASGNAPLNVIEQIGRLTETLTGKGLGKAGAKQDRQVRRAMMPPDLEGSKDSGEAPLPETKTSTAEPTTLPRVPSVILNVVSQCKHRGGITMAELKQTLADGGFSVTNRPVDVVSQQLVNDETLVPTTRNASFRLDNKKQMEDTKQVRTSSVESSKPKKDQQSKALRKSAKGAEKPQRQTRRTRRAAAKSHKRTGKSRKQAAKSQKVTGKTHKPAAKSHKLKGKRRKPAAKSHKLKGKSRKPAAESHKQTCKARKSAAKSHKRSGKTRKPAAKSHKLKGKIHKPAAKSHKRTDKTRKLAAKSHKLEAKTHKSAAESHEPRPETPETTGKSPRPAWKKEMPICNEPSGTVSKGTRGAKMWML